MSNNSFTISSPSSILAKNKFQELVKINDRIAIGHMITRLLLNVFLISLMIYMSQKGFYVALIGVWFAYSAQFHFWGYAGIGHELLHRRVFSSKILNDIFYQLCSSLTWNNAAMYRDTHMLHHRDTFSEKDVEALSVKNWNFIYIIEYLFIDFRTLFRRLFYVVINSAGYHPNFTRLNLNYTHSARVTLIINLVLYLSFYLIFQDKLTTALVLISPFSCSLLSKILAKAQHHELSEFRNEGALKFSRTLILPKFLTFLYANMNYHAEHHFAPTVPYYNLPQLHNLLKNKNLISSKSFWSFFTNEFQTVWLKVSKPD